MRAPAQLLFDDNDALQHIEVAAYCIDMDPIAAGVSRVCRNGGKCCGSADVTDIRREHLPNSRWIPLDAIGINDVGSGNVLKVRAQNHLRLRG